MDPRIWRTVEDWNFWERKPETGIPRDVTETAWRLMGGPEAVYFFGPRRSGKTTVCKQLLSKLSKKFGATSCLYINFEEPSFSGMLSTSSIPGLVEQHKRAHGKKPRFIFLDEAQ